MIYRVLFFIVFLFFLLSCSQKENNLTKEKDINKSIKIEKIETNSGIEVSNCINCNKQLWSKTGAIIFRDNLDLYKKNIKDIEKEISMSGITLPLIIELARNYEYIGNIGKSIEIYESNGDKIEFQKSIVYNHNLAKLYEQVKEYDLALKRYSILIKDLGQTQYLRDLSILFEMMGKSKKAKKAIDAYNKLFELNNVGTDLQVE